MTRKNNRNILLHINKFQKLIIYPILVFCAIAGLMVYLTLEYNIRVSIDPKEHTILNIDVIQYREALPYMLIAIAVMLICIVAWTYYISNRIVGPHDRIINELDQLIEGKHKGSLTVRKDDRMFAEIVKRINKLIGQ
jgi:hypothetical protein